MRRLAAPLLSVALLAGALLGAGETLAAPGPAPGPLMRSTRPPWLGVSMQPAGASGVLVTQVAAGSPAERVGLRVGDRIVSVAGVRPSQPADVQRVVASHAPGDVLAIGLERDGKVVTLSALLAPRPTADEQARALLVGKSAPELRGLVTVNGPPLTTEALRDRVVILDFWATWCVPCRLSLPALSALQARFGAQGLTVLSITTDPAESAADFARGLGLKTAVVLDPQTLTSQSYGVSVLPTTVIIDRRGVVRDVVLGYDKREETRIEGLVQALLAEPSAARTDAGVGAPSPSDAGLRGGAAADAGARPAAPRDGSAP